MDERNQIQIRCYCDKPVKRAFGTAKIIATVLGQNMVCYNASHYGENAIVLIIGQEPALSMLISKIIGGNGNGSIVLTKAGLPKIQNYSY